jgi:membrane AbrB-like protein
LKDISIALGIGLVAAGIGARSGLPGGAIVLPIIAVAGWNFLFAKHSVAVPSWLQLMAFGLLGTTIGLSMDRGSLATLRAEWPVLLLIAISVYVSALLLMIAIAHFFRIDITTAMLAGSPGGLVGVSAVSLSAGANVAQVVAAQTMRILIIFASLPFLIGVLRHFR